MAASASPEGSHGESFNFSGLDHFDPFVPRNLQPIIKRQLSEFRAVMVKGPRQSGKSTLAMHLGRTLNAPYVNLDFPDQRAAAISEPGRLIGPAVNGLMVIDEVQRGGEELLLSIKAAIDRTNRRGQFLLTGSANYLMLPRISESLQGRIAISTLYPYSRGECDRSDSDSFVDAALDDPDALSAPTYGRLNPVDYWEMICTGGYPEVQSRGPEFRSGWFSQLVDTTINREISDLGGISNQAGVFRVLSQCAALSSQELNLQSLMRAAGIARQTANHYLGWLTAAHLVHLVPAWRRSLAQRQIKSQKVLVTDPGLACHLVGKDGFALSQGGDVYRGQALETFVGTELLKQLGWSNSQARLYHWRTVQKAEVDYVIEASDGRVIGIEVKASTSPPRRSAKGLASLRDEVDRAGGKFVHGFLLHLGDRRLPLGDRISALPVRELWSAPRTQTLTPAIMTAARRATHEQAISDIGERPNGSAVTIHLQPQFPRQHNEFLVDSLRQLHQRFVEIVMPATPQLDDIKVQRDFLSYRVVQVEPDQREYICGKLNLDGSVVWRSPISAFGYAGDPRTQDTGKRVTATDIVFAVAVGLKAASEWAGAYCGLRGDAMVSVQFHPSPGGVELGYSRPPPRTVPLSPGVRPVINDLPPIATAIDLDAWQRDPARLLLAAKHFSEHILAAFGLEGVRQIDEDGRITAAGVESELAANVPLWAETVGFA